MAALTGGSFDIGGRGKMSAGMDTVAVVLVSVVVFLTVVVVVCLFVWGAVKDGQEDEAVQARLGIRRRTRLGR